MLIYLLLRKKKYFVSSLVGKCTAKLVELRIKILFYAPYTPDSDLANFSFFPDIKRWAYFYKIFIKWRSDYRNQLFFLMFLKLRISDGIKGNEYNWKKSIGLKEDCWKGKIKILKNIVFLYDSLPHFTDHTHLLRGS